MKTLFSVLFIALLTCSFSKHLLRTQIKSEQSTNPIILSDKDSYIKYASVNLPDDWTIQTIRVKDGSEEIDPTMSVALFEGKNIPAESLPKDIVWTNVLAFFNNPNDIAILKKYLFLKYLEIFRLYKTVLGNKEKFGKCDNYPEFKLQGTIRTFDTGCIKIIYSSGVASEGKMTTINAGSHTFVSDIDLNLDFLPMTEQDKKISIYEKLKTLGSFINKAHTAFADNHNNSTNEAYSVLFYTKSFGYNELLDMLDKLKKFNPNYKKFKAGNRLSVLMLIFNDAADEMKKVNPEDAKAFNEKLADKKLKNLLKKAVMCGNIIAPDSPSKDNIYTMRSEDDAYRNSMYGYHVELAGNSKSELEALCNMIAANFQAIEGYVPVGAMIDVFLLQGIVNYDAEFKAFFDNMDPDFLEDAILMNFAYLAEHFYEHNDDRFEAIRRFSKYGSRMYRVLSRFPQGEQRACWQSVFDKALGAGAPALSKPVYNIGETKDLAKAITAKANDSASGDAYIWMREFIKSGYKCVMQYDLEL
jgi:hypothetical protein